MTKQLKAAHVEVSRHQFGTAQWEAAMQVVRAIAAEEMAACAPFKHTSIDGDIFDRRAP